MKRTNGKNAAALAPVVASILAPVDALPTLNVGAFDAQIPAFKAQRAARLGKGARDVGNDAPFCKELLIGVEKCADGAAILYVNGRDKAVTGAGNNAASDRNYFWNDETGNARRFNVATFAPAGAPAPDDKAPPAAHTFADTIAAQLVAFFSADGMLPGARWAILGAPAARLVCGFLIHAVGVNPQAVGMVGAPAERDAKRVERAAATFAKISAKIPAAQNEEFMARANGMSVEDYRAFRALVAAKAPAAAPVAAPAPDVK